jgi:hypothetical protein
MDAKRPRPHGGYAGRGKLRQSGTTSVRPYPLCWIMQGRTLLKWGHSPFGDLSDCANNLFAAATGHYKLVRPDFKSGQQHSFAEGDFTEGHELDRKWRVPKAMIGRRLSQDAILTPRPEGDGGQFPAGVSISRADRHSITRPLHIHYVTSDLVQRLVRLRQTFVY